MSNKVNFGNLYCVGIYVWKPYYYTLSTQFLFTQWCSIHQVLLFLYFFLLMVTGWMNTMSVYKENLYNKRVRVALLYMHTANVSWIIFLAFNGIRLMGWKPWVMWEGPKSKAMFIDWENFSTKKKIDWENSSLRPCND